MQFRAIKWFHFGKDCVAHFWWEHGEPRLAIGLLPLPWVWCKPMWDRNFVKWNSFSMEPHLASLFHVWCLKFICNLGGLPLVLLLHLSKFWAMPFMQRGEGSIIIIEGGDWTRGKDDSIMCCCRGGRNRGVASQRVASLGSGLKPVEFDPIFVGKL